MADSFPSADIPLTIQGFVTDPKLVGYQILTNYESAYWRALVGAPSWSLYEVLRSYCHNGQQECYPSINLLMATLGIKERRIITGRITLVNGIEYRYPGLIDLLQQHELVIAQEVGTGPMMRYVFHVNLTPGLLSEAQLVQLPDLLQQKHKELLDRCQQSINELQAKRRPSRVQKPVEQPPEGGSGKLPDPFGKLPDPSGKLPDKQYPINTTHRTTAVTRTRKNNNNNTSESSAQSASVVVALVSHGITKKVAQRLADHYSNERIEQKIEYLAYLQQSHPDRVENPRGWLRTAIEEDYAAPDGYLSPEQQQQRTQQAHVQAEAFAHEAQQIQKTHQEAAEAQKAARQQRIQEEYGTTAADRTLWQAAQQNISYMGRSDIYTLIADAEILQWTDDRALIGIATETQLRQLSHPVTQAAIKRGLSQATGRNLTPQFELLV